MKKYINRLFDRTLEFALRSCGAILITGPKWCGKSTTATRYAKTKLLLLDSQNKDQYIELAKNAPHRFLNFGPKPILIDEWQVADFIWDSIKVEVDNNGIFGQYILTGSSSHEGLIKTKDRHSGTGRIVRKMMRPMSLFESGESNGEVSLSKLKDGNFSPSVSQITIDDYAFLVCRGGWPLAINADKDVALAQANVFYDGLVNDDLFNLPDISLRKDVNRAKTIIRSYARNCSTTCSHETLIADVSATNPGFNIKVLNKYLLALTRLYVIDELEAWNTNLRSKTAIRSKPTRHFIDPSIGIASLGIKPDDLFNDLKTFGLLFEDLVVRDLRVYCETIDANIYHYRDKKDREVDAVIKFKDGKWGLIEVKLANAEEIDESAKKLINLVDDINENDTKPSFLMVITATNIAYQRKDGVYVVPLACLKN